MSCDLVTGVQRCVLPIFHPVARCRRDHGCRLPLVSPPVPPRAVRTAALPTPFFRGTIMQSSNRFIARVATAAACLGLLGACASSEVRGAGAPVFPDLATATFAGVTYPNVDNLRSEEHTSELQSLMRISYAVFCLKKKTQKHYININT